MPGAPAAGCLPPEPRVDGRADVRELAVLVHLARGIAPGSVGEQQGVLARVVGRRGRRIAAVVGREDQEVALPQRVEDVGQPPIEVLQAAMEVDRVVAVAPEHVGLDEVDEDESSTDSRSSIVRLMPSTFDLVGNDSSTSHPAKMSWIFPTP